MVRGGKMGTEYSKIGKRVPQQYVPALDPLDEILLPTRTRGKGFDGSAFPGLRTRSFTQSIQRLIVRICHMRQRIVVSGQAGACGQHLPIQSALDLGKIIERTELTIIASGIQVQATQ